MAEAPSDLPHAMRRMEADLPFQHRSWQVERLSWAMLLVLVAAGLLGIFGGSGPLVAATALTPDEAIRLRYERVQRLLLRTTLLVELPRARPDGQLELRLGPEMLEGWEIHGTMPSAVVSRSGSDGVTLVFETAPAGAGTTIRLMVEPRRVGVRRLSVAAGDGPPSRPAVLIWP
ncbi:hypothetical protein GCM10011504_51160 [Siccirubricoccus deserti]|uniref:Uncharacterized protein n=1 Tax=Siccirubricoccus deserti TaxID=2013562 RepID=A0A9X0UG55_9PROT|nr:hypothetical protein [Siccirubricoccus deserti]MBC4018583.1 hypothetical protein [Siccirubricoccus deserti]GGC66943.1 hypothetical protein GCM10011504_51160 [Siccirubricoccus deserti]